VLRRFLILRIKYVTTGRNERDSDLPALLKVYAVLAASIPSQFSIFAIFHQVDQTDIMRRLIRDGKHFMTLLCPDEKRNKKKKKREKKKKKRKKEEKKKERKGETKRSASLEDD